jgi:hypothetical protein
MQWLRRFMAGRYGTDSLNKLLSAVSIILLLLSMFTGMLILYALAMLFLAYAMFRSFSRDTYKRSRENQIYWQARQKVFSKFPSVKTQFRQRKTHRFYKCKSCRATLRVPKGRGRMVITCPKCHASFESKT